MKKTLLLCFIHGFKGGDDTFGSFPEHVRALAQNGLPKLEVKALVYPKFETRGDLAECVSRFRDWLQNKVIDIEVENNTPSPTLDPSVRVILIGHSMGGIVAADTAIAIASDTAVTTSEVFSESTNTKPELSSLLFPHVQGVLAFDTPYLGLSPGVVAHGAEKQLTTAQEAYQAFSGLSGALWGGNAVTEQEAKGEAKKPVAALPAPSATDSSVPAWKKWGTMALYAGAGAAVAAGGAAAYKNRETISGGWSWVGSHLEFVGCLMKGEELRKRLSTMVTLNRELGIGFGNIYTTLGKKARSKSDGSMVGSVIGHQRVFCNLPKKDAKEFWTDAVNDAAEDEVSAHMNMFLPKFNPGYHALSETAKDRIIRMIGTQDEWYMTASVDTMAVDQEL